MPFVEVSPGVRIWTGPMTPEQELEFMTRATRVQSFPSVNHRAQVQALPSEAGSPPPQQSPEEPSQP